MPKEKGKGKKTEEITVKSFPNLIKTVRPQAKMLNKSQEEKHEENFTKAVIKK